MSSISKIKRLFYLLDIHEGAVISILTLFLVIFTAYYAFQANETTNIMEEQTRIITRPYLEITNPKLVTYNKAGEILYDKYGNYHSRSDNKVNRIRPINTLINSGIIPAEIISIEYDFPELSYSPPYNLKEISIYKDVKMILSPPNDIIVTGGLILAFEKYNNKITIKVTVKYKIHGKKEIFQAYNEAKCEVFSTGEKIKTIECLNLNSYTT